MSEEMMLNLTIVPVGPRDAFQLANGAVWRFAMQVSVSFTRPPEEQEIARWARAMLPWIALGRPGGEIDIAWRWFKPGLALGINGTAKAKAEGELALPIREDLENGFWERFAEIRKPGRDFVVDTSGAPVETGKSTIFLPSVLQSFGGATPEVSSNRLQCTWYFDIELDVDMANAMIAALEGNDPIGIAAWPAMFVDDRTPMRFLHRQNIDVPFQFKGTTVLIPYRDENDVAFHHGQALPFPVRRLLKTTEPALKTYWLRTADSRLDSLADIEAVVAHALSLRARIAALTPELILAAKIRRNNVADPVADVRQFLDFARKLFDKDDPPDPAVVRKMIADALHRSKAAFVAELRAEIATAAKTWWEEAGVVKAINIAARDAGVTSPDHPWSNGTPSFVEFAKSLLPENTEIKPLLPGEGISVLLGEADTRLRHEESGETANDSDHAQIAALGVLVRRARTPDELRERAWSLATATVAVLGRLDGDERYWGSEQPETLPHSKLPVVRGIASTFVNGLSSTDVTYFGLPLAAATIGSALHGHVGAEEEVADADADYRELLPLTYQTVGPVKDEDSFKDVAPFTMAPPLRYGDWYQFAGFVIDRGGGTPAELGKAGKRPLSCNFDWEKLAAGKIPALDDSDPEAGTYRAIEFLRRVPVGEINLRPMPGTVVRDKAPQWPPLPGGVVLRAREWLAARAPKSDSVPALLLSDGDEFLVKNRKTEFRISAPQLDEHTLSRWMMPGALAPNEDPQQALAAVEKLNDVIAEIHRKRAELPEDLTPDWEKEHDVLEPDPAVTKIGVRCTFVDQDAIAIESQTFLGGQSTLVISAEVGTANAIVGTRITLRPGSFAAIELVPLVSAKDFARFEELAMRQLLEDEPWVHPTEGEFRAFQPSRILIEAASPALPDEKALYDALRLSVLPNGAIDISLVPPDGGVLPGMAFADRFELSRQRWVWRNRPVFAGKAQPAQSDLPRELAGDDRDIALSVLQFDALAELDRGMVDRGLIGGRVPRASDGTPLAQPRLMIDDRDAVSHADYLRFGCTLISRYEGILRPDKRQTRARSVHDTQEKEQFEPKRMRKRVTAPFRGDLTCLKAPKVLAILPLTQGLGDIIDLTDVSAEATPFLIVLDEIWFREYGPGERLNVEVVLETKEIGEKDEARRPFRVGPLPDHYVAAHLNGLPHDKRLYETSTDAVQDKEPLQRHVFPLFGPFGHSLDRSGNEALANATAFIAFPPKGVAPHYAAFVRMRRVLHGVDGEPVKDRAGLPVEGPPGTTYALYTQPDAKQLIGPEEIALHVRADDRYDGLPLHLRPAPDTHLEVTKQYAYLLIVGPTLRDFGRGSNLFVPSHAAWLDAPSQSLAWATKDDLRKGRQSARVLELLLNGRFDTKPPIKEKKSLKEILEALFGTAGNPEDAPAMIRRISPEFPVVVD
jgi:hypothetical protein